MLGESWGQARPIPGHAAGRHSGRGLIPLAGDRVGHPEGRLQQTARPSWAPAESAALLLPEDAVCRS